LSITQRLGKKTIYGWARNSYYRIEAKQNLCINTTCTYDSIMLSSIFSNTRSKTSSIYRDLFPLILNIFTENRAIYRRVEFVLEKKEK